MRKQDTGTLLVRVREMIHPGLLTVLGLCFMVFLSCEHDSVDPVTPSPGDTTQQPLDTMVFDTMDEVITGIPCHPDSIYFNRDILPILQSNCAKSGCHDVSSHKEDLILDSYANVMASGIVKPYNLNGSDLYEVITETDPDKRMPEPPNQELSADQIALISKWILQGAKELTCDDNAGTCDTTNVTYSGYVAPLLSAYCVGCHSGGAPSGNILLNSHASVQTLAFDGRLMGAITWTYGFSQMPKGAAKLSNCKISKIKAWVNDGAQNN